VNQDDLEKVESFLIEKMAVYLCKMSMHDYYLSTKKPSLIAVGSIYVALKICEQLKKKQFISQDLVGKLISSSRFEEQEILDVS